MAALVADWGLRAAGCWACSEAREKCFLLAAAPSAAGNFFRSALYGFPFSLSIDAENEGASSVASAILNKAPVVAVVLPSGHVQGDAPADLRQLYERLCRSAPSPRAGQGSASFAGAWHLAALPLVVQGVAVGALLLVGQVGEPVAKLETATGGFKAAVEAATAARVSAAASLAEEFFGTTSARSYAQRVTSLVAAVSGAPDHASAVRDAAAHIFALLPSALSAAPADARCNPAKPSLAASPSSSPTPPPPLGPSMASSPLAAAAPPQPLRCGYRLVVTTGLVVSRGPAAARSCAPSNGAVAAAAAAASSTNGSVSAASNAGPQLHLYCAAGGKPSVTIPANETLIVRAPIRADTLAAMLKEALAAPVSSAGLAAAVPSPRGPGAANAGARGAVPSLAGSVTQQNHQQKLLALRCPEDELPPSQPRTDLAALEAAGARAPRGSVMVMSCPLPSIMCAVVAYVCVVPVAAVESCGGGGSRGVLLDPPAGMAAQAGAAAALQGVQLPEAKLKVILQHASAALEVLAGALEQRMVSSCAISPARRGSRGLCTVDVTADTSGLVTVSLAGTDGEDSNGFWGSASGPILSGESIPTSHLSAAANVLGASPNASGGTAGFSFGRSPEVRTLHALSACARAGAPGTVSAAPASPLAMSSFAVSHVAAGKLCSTPSSGSGPEDGDDSSGYVSAATSEADTASGVHEGLGHRAVTAGAGRTSDQPPLAPPLPQPISQPPPPNVPVAADPAQEAGLAGAAAGAAEPSIAKVPCSSSRLPSKAAERPSDTDDVSQDIAVESAVTVAAAAATAAVAVAGGIRGASTTAATSFLSGSCTSGVETTIKALACEKLNSGRFGHRSSALHDSGDNAAAAAPAPALGPAQQPTAVQLMLKGPAPVLLTRALRPGAACLLPGSSGGGAAAAPAALGSHPHNTAFQAATAAAAAGTVAATATAVAAMAQQGAGGGIGPPAEALRQVRNASSGQARPFAEEGLSPLPGFGSSGGAVGAAGGAGIASGGNTDDQMARTMIRNRSKDWSDQAGEPESLDSRIPPPGATAAPPRLHPIKVLSLDKAAQHLQRSSGSSLAVTFQPVLPLPPLLLQEQQQQAVAAAQDGKDAGPQQTMATQAGPTAAAVAAMTTTAAPPPYVPYAPRRLNRMYLPSAAPTAAGGVVGNGGLPVNPAGAAPTATRIAGPFGVVAAAAAASQATPPPPPPPPMQLSAHAIDLSGDAAALVGAALAGRTSAAQSAPFATTPSGAARLLAALNPTSGPGASSSPVSPERSVPVSPAVEPVGTPPPTLRPPASASAQAAPAPRYMPPSAVTAAAAATMAAARAAGGSAGGESPAASANTPKSRQLSDYAIPEDTPLEYTVSETVQMMRMLAQARGVHLSARMRRVRVTAKIQSAHPEALPPDLPSQLAKTALLAPGGGGGGGTWVLTGVAARRGCIELVFDVVQVRGSGGGGTMLESQHFPLEARRRASANSCRRPSSPQLRCASGASHAVDTGGYVRFGQVSQPQVQAQAPPGQGQGGGVSSGSFQSYRRWQGAGADGLVDPLGLFEEADNEASRMQSERAAGRAAALYDGGAAAVKAQAAGGGAAVALAEQLWLRNACGLRPEAVAEALQSCGLLSGGCDPFVDVQVGHSAAGAATLVWHEPSGQWLATAGGGATAAADATTAAGAAACTAGPLEAPTLWLPCSVALLARGARFLQDIRLVSTSGGGTSGVDVVDEVTVRHACSYLPVRVAAGLRMHVGGAGSGSSVPPLPLLLEDDPVAEALADGACCWRLMDVGGALPRSGGLLLVECRRTAAAATGPSAGGNGAAAAAAERRPPSLVDPPSLAPAPAAVTSAPVPLLVLPEKHAAAAAELQRLRVFMARMLLGSEEVLRAAPPAVGGAALAPAAASARAEAAAQVEMACQQFLMDLGALVDAAASIQPAAVGASAPASARTSPPGLLSCLAARYSADSGGGGGEAAARPPPYSFSEVHSVHHSKRPQLPELQVSPVCTTDALSSMPSCSSPLTMLGGCAGGRVSELATIWTSDACGAGRAGSGPPIASTGLCSFADDMTGLFKVRCTSGSGAGSGAGGAAAGSVTEFGEHLMDVACTVLAGCCAAGMHHTALMVLRAACGELSLAVPEVLLAEAGANPRVSLDLLMAYAAQAGQGAMRPDGGAAAALSASAVPVATAAAAPAAEALTLPGGHAAAAAASMAPEQVNPSEVEWSNITDGHAVANGTNSRSHSLAVMLVGTRSSGSTPLSLQERGRLEAPSAEFGGWQQVDAHSAATQELRSEQGEEQEDADADELTGDADSAGAAAGPVEAFEAADVWRQAAEAARAAGASSSSLSPARRPLAPRALAVGMEITHQGSTGDLLPTWGSISAAGTPDTGTRTGSQSRPVSNLLGSADVALAAEAAVVPAPAVPEAPPVGSAQPVATRAASDSASPPPPPRLAEISPIDSAAAEAPPPPQSARPPAAPEGPRRSAAPSRAASCTSVSSRRTSPSHGSRAASARSSGAGCSSDPAPADEETEDEDEAGGAGGGCSGLPGPTAAPCRGGPGGAGGGGRAAVHQQQRQQQQLLQNSSWALRFSDPAMEAEYMQFVATRTCSIMWSYFVWNVFISAVSCTRAWMEDGPDGCLSLLVFSCLQGVIMGFYCVVCGAREPRAMVAAAVGSKAVRLAADVLMGTGVLKVPSLMEPMAARGVEVPFASFCLMSLLELPCVWLLYTHFRTIFPVYWLRNYPLARALIYTLLSNVMNAVAELYWRREFRRWVQGGCAAAGGSGGAAAVGFGPRGARAGGAAEDGAALVKPNGKDE